MALHRKPSNTYSMIHVEIWQAGDASKPRTDLLVMMVEEIDLKAVFEVVTKQKRVRAPRTKKVEA